MLFSSRRDRIRTCDLCVPNAALYQAEPRADIKLLDFDSTSRMQRSTKLSCTSIQPSNYILYWIGIASIFLLLYRGGELVCHVNELVTLGSKRGKILLDRVCTGVLNDLGERRIIHYPQKRIIGLYEVLWK